MNALDAHGWAPLHVAAGAGRLDAMNLLVKAGAAWQQRLLGGLKQKTNGEIDFGVNGTDWSRFYDEDFGSDILVEAVVWG